MSSYNSRRKDYAKKLLDKHIKENFYPEATPEIKYYINKKDGITVITVSHDIENSVKYADRIINLSDNGGSKNA